MILRLGPLAIQINWLVLLCFFSSLGMFVSLAFWQLDRAAEKRALVNSLEQRAELAPAPLDLAERTELFGNMSRVVVSGQYEPEVSFLVMFQFFRGQPGFELVTPFRRDDGSLVLVSRGWLAADADGGVPQLPVIEGAVAEGAQQLTAQVHIPDFEIPPVEVSDNSWPVRLSRLNVEQAGRLLGEPLYPYVLRLESGQAGVLDRHWQPPRISIRTHIAYAVQWFAIALLVSIAALLYSSNLLQLLREKQSSGRGV